MTIESEKKFGTLPNNLRLRGDQYFADFRVRHQRYRVALKTTSLLVAKQRLKEVINKACQGDLDQDLNGCFTLREWVDEYIRTHLVNRVPRSQIQCSQILNNEIVPFLKPSIRLTDITTASLIRLRATLWSNVKSATQNRKFALVKHLFSEARRRKLIKEDPARDIQKLKETHRASRTLNERELKELIMASPEPLRSFIRLAAFTGLRLGELQGLRWKNIELDSETNLFWIRLRNSDQFRTKSGRDRDVPVHEQIISPILVLKQTEDSEEFVFKTPKKGERFHPRRAWRQVIKKLSLHGFTFHGLRRTYGTYLHRGGAPLGSVQKLMGHSSITQTRGYIDVNNSDLISAMKGLDQTLINLGLNNTNNVIELELGKT